jgi:hypothetical protein
MQEMAEYYKAGNLSSGQLMEIKESYIHMARGGNGNYDGYVGHIRGYYPGKEDAFFQGVCNLMGWEWRP